MVSYNITIITRHKGVQAIDQVFVAQLLQKLNLSHEQVLQPLLPNSVQVNNFNSHRFSCADIVALENFAGVAAAQFVELRVRIVLNLFAEGVQTVPGTLAVSAHY